MAATTLQWEKEAAVCRWREETAAAATRSIATPATVTAAKSIDKPPIITPPANPTTSVASPPSTANLNSLLSGHVGQEGSGVDADTSTIMADSDADKEKPTSATKKKPKKSKDKTSSNSSSKCDSFGSVLKQGRSATAAALQTIPPVPSKEFAHKGVYYEAGLELKGEDKHAAYVKQIGLLFENIQLVDPTAIMHVSVELATAKPLGAKSEMSDNMMIFLGYAPVGGNSNVFKPKKNNNKNKGRHGKDEPDLINPSVYPTLIFSTNVDPDTITSRVAHEFCRARGFYFRKKISSASRRPPPSLFITYTPSMILLLFELS